MAVRTGWAPWQLWYWMSRPSSPHQATAVRPSMGQAATRWLTMRWDTTTSHSEKSATRLRASIDQITFDSASAKQLGVAVAGRLGIDDGGQRVVVDEDGLGRVGALLSALGDDGDDRLADEPHHVAGQQRAGHRLVHGGRRRRQVVQVDVRGGDDGEDAGQRQGLARVDLASVGRGRWWIGRR